MGQAARALATTAVCGVLILAWRASGVDADLGLRPIRTLILPTIACVVLAFVLAYTPRKHLWHLAQRLFPLPADFDERVARAHQRIGDLQRAIYNGGTTPAEARKKASQILRDSRLWLYYRPEFFPSESPNEAQIRIRLVRRVWMGGLQGWLQLHAHLGIVLFVLFALHAGLSLGQPLAALSVALLLGVVLTGLAGVAVYQLLPEFFTDNFRDRLPEDMERVAWLLEQRAFQLVSDPESAAILRTQLGRVNAHGARTRRRKLWTDGWRVLHIALAIAWVLAFALHGLTHWYY